MCVYQYIYNLCVWHKNPFSCPNLTLCLLNINSKYNKTFYITFPTYHRHKTQHLSIWVLLGVTFGISSLALKVQYKKQIKLKK